MRSWCGANRRRTPASRATRRSSERAAAAAHARLQPGLKLLPRPVVHPDLAAAAALAAPYQQRAAARVQVSLGQRERLADPQPGPPQHHDQAAQPAAVDPVAGAAHHRHDLLIVGGSAG